MASLPKFLPGCILMLLCFSLLSACKGEVPEKHVFSTQEKALKKAQAVQSKLDEHERINRKMVSDAFK